jgi:hypothetical protein
MCSAAAASIWDLEIEDPPGAAAAGDGIVEVAIAKATMKLAVVVAAAWASTVTP